VSGVQLDRGALLGYAALALPLAMAALPIYVHVPKLYSTIGMPLAWVGAILLGARLLDALQDPLLGFLSDRAASRRLGRKALVVGGIPLLGAGLLALLNPPEAGAATLALWLAASLLVTYLGFSAASISYLAIGAELSADYHERTRVTAVRGAIGVMGVLAAATLPEWLGDAGEADGLARFSLIFLPLMLACGAITLLLSPVHPAPVAAAPWKSMLLPFRNAGFRWLMAVSVASGIAGAIPGTLILFFVEDVLARPQFAGVFLGLYFISGALGMPAWVSAAKRYGKKNAWLIGMVLAVIAFVWAFALGEGDVAAFSVVCVLSGLAYGAELAIPASLLADVVDGSAPGAESRPDGAYFGLWQMIEKLNLALAAGIALPVLAVLGYEPGMARGGPVLSGMYAVVPCVIKIGAAALLWIAPLDRVRPVPGTVAQQGVAR
jgi:Na+/melibiose symporter-like transporter